MLLSEMTFNPVPTPGPALAGLALLALALWAGGITVVLRRGWAAKLGGSGLLLGALLSTLFAALLLLVAPPTPPTSQQGTVEMGPEQKPFLDQPARQPAGEARHLRFVE